MFKFLSVTVILALSVFVLTGCNTVAGIGADLHDLATGTQDRMGERRYSQPMPSQHGSDNGSVRHNR